MENRSSGDKMSDVSSLCYITCPPQKKCLCSSDNECNIIDEYEKELYDCSTDDGEEEAGQMEATITAYDKSVYDWLTKEKVDDLCNHFYHNISPDKPREYIFDPAYNLYSEYVRNFAYCGYDHLIVEGPWWHHFVDLWRTKLQQFCILLPYWCCCSGDDLFHRHIIVSYHMHKQHYFRDTIMSICERGVVFTPIESPLHLIHTICYVSNKASVCTSSVQGLLPGGPENHHVCIARPTPPFADLFLSLSYKGGLREWLIYKYKQADLMQMLKLVKRVNGKWTIKAGDLCELRGIVVPIKKDLQFSSKAGKNKLYFSENSNVTIKRNGNVTNLSDEDWHQYQINRGNMLMDCISSVVITLPEDEQDKLDQFELISMHNIKVVDNCFTI